MEKMGFWDHVEALRGVILRSLFVVLSLSIAFFALMPWLFDNVILAPCGSEFVTYRFLDYISTKSGIAADFIDHNFSVELVNIQLASQFFIHMSTSLWMAVVFAFPIIIYFIWAFVAPALYPSEKNNLSKVFVLGNVMFYLGVVTGYLLVFPLTLRFLSDYQISMSVPNIISLDSYIDNFLMLILMMGIIYELPLVAWLIGKTGLLNKSFFKKYRRHAVVALLALAAIITPTGDPFTLIVVFLPIYALWELSVFLVPSENSEEENLKLTEAQPSQS